MAKSTSQLGAESDPAIVALTGSTLRPFRGVSAFVRGVRKALKKPPVAGTGCMGGERDSLSSSNTKTYN